MAEDEAAARAPCHVGEVLSSSNFGQTGPVMALAFPLVISYDHFFLPKVVKLFFFFKFYLRELFLNCCKMFSMKVVS